MRRADIHALLPAVIGRGASPGSPLDALLRVMEMLHAPVETALASQDDLFHPLRCPSRFVAYLSTWVDLDRLLSDNGHGGMELPSGIGHLRALVAGAARLSKWRGTERGFIEFLETATGVSGFHLEDQVAGPDGEPRPFVLRLHVPPPGVPHLDLIRRVVESEKPAYVICEVVLPAPPGADAHMPPDSFIHVQPRPS